MYAVMLLVLVFATLSAPQITYAGQATKIQAFVVPHSHMDVGWVYTVKVRQLLEEERLEFIIGGQVMHDEAVTTVEDQILQLTAWTGFYASRNVLKGMARRASSLLYAAESLFTQYLIMYPKGSIDKDWALKQLENLRWAVSEVQHHDGITGTESPKVCDMYIDHLTQGMMAVKELMAALLIIPRKPLKAVYQSSSSNGDQDLYHYVLVYNPLAWNITTFISIMVAYPVALVYDEDGNPVPAQIQKSKESIDMYDLYIFVKLVGLGYKKYSVKFQSSPCVRQFNCLPTYLAESVQFDRQSLKKSKKRGLRLLPVMNECYTLMFDQASNLLYSITNRETGKTLKITQDFLEYHANGDVYQGPISDNYIFTSNGSAESVSKDVKMEIVIGKLVTEIRQYFYSEKSEQYSYAIYTRLYNVPAGYNGVGSEVCHRIEQEYRVGPLELNREAILRTYTEINNEKTIFTDNNGYQMLKRQYRAYVNNTIARNYYPMVRTAYIEDDSTRLVILSERTHGISSLDNGQVEVMLHRRLWNNQEWNNGYNLTLNDTSIIHPVLWLMVGAKPAMTALYSRNALSLEHRPIVMVLKSSGNINEAERDFNRVLLRITHLYEQEEDPVLSQPAAINIQKMLKPLGVVSYVEERSLTGTWDVNELQRMKWKTSQNKSKETKGAVKVTQAPLYIGAVEGDSVQMTCSWETTKEPEEVIVKFSKNNILKYIISQINNGKAVINKFTLINNKRQATFHISNVKKEDEGKYYCQATIRKPQHFSGSGNGTVVNVTEASKKTRTVLEGAGENKVSVLCTSATEFDDLHTSVQAAQAAHPPE
ncbi:MA2B2 mannosidase, partial [Polypterus senegalus]